MIGVIFLIDFVYQGFGDGLEEDVVGMWLIVLWLFEVLIVVFCFKNFGIYCECIGILLVLCLDVVMKDLVQGVMVYLNCQIYFFLFFYGVKIVLIIFGDDVLCVDWQVEFEDVCGGMLCLCEQLVCELCDLLGLDRFDFIVQYCGMFLCLGVMLEQVVKMCDQFVIYMVGDLWLNIVGLNDQIVLVLVCVIIEVGV